MEASEINQELFDKVYGEGAVKDEAEFRQKSEKKQKCTREKLIDNDE